MTTVPSNLIPTRITQLPEYVGASTAGYLPYVIDGVTYKVQFSNIAAVGAVPSTRTITGGGGLTGGGDLSADRVISIAAGGVGFSQLADSGVAPGTYGDSTSIPVLTVDAKGRVTGASTTPISLSNYVPITRAILAGDGLTGGGTLSADRTISMILSTAAPQSGGTPAAGTATVAAREDHVHPAVDLTDTTETSGVLPMSRGGTGNSLSPVAGAIVYSDGSDLNLSNPGTADQVFFSGGTGSPVWRSLTGGTTGLSFGLSGSAYALSGTLAVASGGTGLSSTPSNGQLLIGDGSGFSLATLTAGSNITITNSAGGITIAAAGGGGTGTVTSVDASGGTTGLTFTGGPVTTSGTLTLGGTLGAASGGTGHTSYASGQLLIGKADGTLAKATLTAGTGISVSNGDGSVTVTNSAPDQIVGLTAGTGISVSGSYPNFTVTNSAPDQVVSLTAGTNVTITGSYPNFTIAASGGGGGSGTVTSVDVSGGTTGLTFTGGPVTSSGTITMGGTLAIANGGTGGTTAVTARANLLPSYATNAGKVLAVNAGATDVEWIAVGGSGTVTSVNVSGGTTGLTTSGGPITGSGTITLAGTLATTNGGTGQTSYTDGQLLIGKTDGTLAKSTLTAGTGISVTNGNGTVTVTNSAPDQTVTLTAGTGISVSGTYPSFTVTNSAPDQTVVLTGAGTTSVTGTYPNFTITSNDAFTGTVTSVGGTGSVNGITLTGTVTSSGNLTLGGTLSGVDLATQTTGTLAVGRGGTGATTLTGVVKGNGTSAFTAGTVSLTSEVSGTLPIGNGGTGVTGTPTNGQLLIGNGTGYSLASLTAGSNITITPGAGTITIAASGGLSVAEARKITSLRL